MEHEIDVKPCRNRVLVQPLTSEEVAELEDRTVVLVEKKQLVDMIHGMVLDIGPKVTDVAIGDKVLLPAKYMARPDAKFILVKETDILGIDDDPD